MLLIHTIIWKEPHLPKRFNSRGRQGFLNMLVATPPIKRAKEGKTKKED